MCGVNTLKLINRTMAVNSTRPADVHSLHSSAYDECYLVLGLYMTVAVLALCYASLNDHSDVGFYYGSVFSEELSHHRLLNGSKRLPRLWSQIIIYIIQ